MIRMFAGFALAMKDGNTEVNRRSICRSEYPSMISVMRTHPSDGVTIWALAGTEVELPKIKIISLLKRKIRIGGIGLTDHTHRLHL